MPTIDTSAEAFQAGDFSSLISSHLKALQSGLAQSCEHLATEREAILRKQNRQLQQENQEFRLRLDLEHTPAENSTANCVDDCGAMEPVVSATMLPEVSLGLTDVAFRPCSHDVAFKLLPEYLVDNWVKADRDCYDEGFLNWIDEVDPHHTTKSWVLNPSSGRRLFWDILGIPILAWDLITIPLGVFDIGMAGEDVMQGAGWVTLIFWSIDLPATFMTGFFNVDGDLVMKNRLIASNYLQGSFGLDILIIFADWISVFLKLFSSGSGIAENMSVLRVFRVTRFVRLLRLRKLKAKIQSIEDGVNSEYVLVVMNLIGKVCAVFMFTHYVGCAWVFIGSQDAFDVPSRRWLTSLPYPQYDSDGLKMSDAEWAYQYFSSLHWALGQFTPGPQNIQPQNSAERIFAVFILLLGLVVFSSFIAGVTQARMQLTKMMSKLDRDLWILRKFCQQRGVSRELSSRMKRYIDLVIVPNFHKLNSGDVALLPKLSAHLRSELNKELISQIICIHPFFEHIKTHHDGVMNGISNGCISILSLARGDVAFGSGQVAHSMLLVSEGQLDFIAVSGYKEKPPEQVGKGRWISEAVLWTKWIHQGQMQASIESTAMEVNAAKLCAALLESGPAMGFVRRYGQEFIRLLNDLVQVSGVPTDIHDHLTKDFHTGEQSGKVAFLWKSVS